MPSKHKLVKNAILNLGGKCHFREAFNYINSTDFNGLTHQELRGIAMSLSDVELKDDILRLI